MSQQSRHNKGTPAHRLEMMARALLAKLGRRASEERGALSTEMMLLAAIVTIIAIAAGGLLYGAMTNAANQIPDNPSVVTGGG